MLDEGPVRVRGEAVPVQLRRDERLRESYRPAQQQHAIKGNAQAAEHLVRGCALVRPVNPSEALVEGDVRVQGAEVLVGPQPTQGLEHEVTEVAEQDAAVDDRDPEFE